jgi:hypothetical protein
MRLAGRLGVARTPYQGRPGRCSQLAFASVVAGLAIAHAAAAGAQERLCDNSYEDCRAPILDSIRRETVGIDVSYWFMTDARYSNEIIRRWRAGVPVRILLDPRADQSYPAAVSIRNDFAAAGIPIRRKFTNGINHWKMILYAGQQTVHFSAANFASGSYAPIVPYREYVDEAVYFTDDPDVVTTFMAKYDDLWTDTRHYADFANISGPLMRHYPAYPLHPDLNFPPDQDYADRLVSEMRRETQQIDVVIFRITSAKLPDEILRRHAAGVPIRLITEPRQYRNSTYLWHAYNVDRMYAAGVPIKWKVNATEQDMHQKSVVLHGRDRAVFGSSNWTSSSSDTQREHNYFTGKPWIVEWFKAQFLRKWNNVTIDGASLQPPMFVPFEPGAPGVPSYVSPSNGATDQPLSVTLRWEGGSWAHKYDIYFGTTAIPPLAVQDFMPGSATAGVRTTKESYTFSGLAPGTTYYWRITSKTMADRIRDGAVHRFTTAGDVAPPSERQAPVIEDAYVRDGAYANSTFGAAAELIAKFGADARYRREAYLKVDVRTISASDRVVLRLFGALSDARAASVTTTVRGSSAVEWSQQAVTWNTRPPLESTVGTLTVIGTSPAWYEVDVTAYVQARRSGGAATVTLGLRNDEDSLPYATFRSTEASANRPQVLVSRAGDPALVADAYARSGSYAATNYGAAPELVAKRSADPQYGRQTFLKVDISTVPPGASIALRLFGRLSDARAPSVIVEVYGSDDTGWSESGLTWNNMPAAVTGLLGTISVAGTASAWYEIDLTDYVQSRRAVGAGAATVVIKGAEETLPFVSFSSRESSDGPRLTIVPGR